jgi:formamidopyrimidine-DNA glycosylase
MPERAEVFLFTSDFKSKFPPGTQIKNIKTLVKDKKFNLIIPDTDYPLTVKRVGSKGKKTYIYLTNGMGFLVSYGMSGGWKIKKTDFAKYCFVRADGYKYYWQCQRKLHCEFVHYLPKADIRAELAKLGLDIMRTNEPSRKEILERYLSKRGKLRRCEVHTFLMDQTAFCGIGNYLLCRTLYLLAISPHRRVSDLTNKEKIALYTTVKEIVTEVVARQGHTIFDWARDDDRWLEPYDVTPYGARGKRDGNGHRIKAEAISKTRTIYWVPAVQK